MRLSIIICTYNRAKILCQCLEKLVSQDLQNIEIIIVDNNSTDDTKLVVQSYPIFKYVHEPNQGLSFARNRGALEARSEWLLYIDDDAIPFENLIERFLYTINNYDFDCFGGTHIVPDSFIRPKWMDKCFGNMVNPIAQLGYLNKPLLTGGLFAIKRQLLIDIGLFDVHLGMKGEKIGYAEEDEIQKRLLFKGFKLGFDPEFKIYHPILTHKLKLIWHLKSEFAHGRDGEKSRNANSLFSSIFFLIRTTGYGFVKLPLRLFKCLINPNYYWQNAVLDSIGPVSYRIGQFLAKLN